MVNNSIEDLKQDLQRFGTYDYVIFGLSLAICAVIGIYYAFWGKNKENENDEDEYLVGGRNMPVFPVALSLLASVISGIYILGTPTEVYTYGTEYMFMIIPMVLVAIFSSYVTLPVFHNLQLSSAFEYLELRFDKKVRLFGAALFTICIMMWLSIVLYMPALAFNQVTGVHIYITTSCVSIICIFYTCLGGLKAVVWTDFIQTWIMFTAVLIVIIKGTMDVGGFGVVWERSWQGDRIVAPSLDLDPTVRNSWLATIVGGICFYAQALTFNQDILQKYMTLPSLSKARRAAWIFNFLLILITLLVGYMGLLVYATFYDCDPVKTNLVEARDQIVPLLVMKIVGDYPGLPGVFIAGIFSASLSALSSGLNAMSAVVLKDFVKANTSKTLTGFQSGLIMRGSVIFFGALAVGLVFIIEKLGTVLQLSASLESITSGPMIGVFCCGMLLPWINAKGALAGGIVGLIANGIVVIGAQQAIASGDLTFPIKPTTTDGCDYDFNTTIVNAVHYANHVDAYVFPLFKISYLLYMAVGGIITTVTAVIVSYFTGFTDLKTLNSKTIVWKFKHE